MGKKCGLENAPKGEEQVNGFEQAFTIACGEFRKRGAAMQIRDLTARKSHSSFKTDLVPYPLYGRKRIVVLYGGATRPGGTLRRSQPGTHGEKKCISCFTSHLL